MKALRGIIMVALMLVAARVSAACSRPAWERFKQRYLSDDGRVIDPSNTRQTGMMHDSAPQKARLKSMQTMTVKKGVPPGNVNVATGKAQGHGPVGFSAALLPFLQERDAQAAQRQRVADNVPGKDAYYNYVLTLFGQGWDEHRFRFTPRGELQPNWGQQCTNSH